MTDTPASPGTSRDGIALILLFTLGAAAWIVIGKVSGRRELWDSELYFSVFLPSIAIIIATVSWFIPVRVWRWAFMPFVGQAVAAFAQNPTANLMPLGLIVFGVLGAICLVPALLAARLRRTRH